MLGRSALLGATSKQEPWQGNYSNVSLLLRNGTPSSVTSYLDPVDESPAPKTITNAGTATSSASVVKYGSSAMYFSGAETSRYEVADSNDLNLQSTAYTIEFWIYPDYSAGFPTYALIAGKMAFVFSGWSIWLNSGKIDVWFDGSYITSAISQTLSNRQWTHVALVDTGSGTVLYVNGVNVSSTSTRNTTTNSLALCIGGAGSANWNSNWPFTGYVDDLRITKGIARYTSGFTPPPAELPNY